MKTKKQKLASVIYCILQTIVGVLLLINPVTFTSGIIITIGVFLLITGIISIVKYFTTPVKEASEGQILTKGLLIVLLGLICVCRTDWLIITFPVVTIIYGMIMLVIGLSKIQVVADAVRNKEEKWFWGVISALITLICAAIIITNPFSSTAALWMFTGISIIVDAIFDLAALVFVKESDTANT